MLVRSLGRELPLVRRLSRPLRQSPGSGNARQLAAPRRSNARATPHATLNDYVAVVLPHLDANLVSTHARISLTKISTLLPASDLAGFEFSLGAGDDVDLILRIPRIGFAALPPHLASDPNWQFVFNLSRELAEGRPPLAGLINVLDLEFDVAKSSPVPRASLFAELNRDPPLDVESLIRVAERLQGKPLSSPLATSLTRCWRALPRAARIIHLGVMNSRPSCGLRVVASRIPNHGLFTYLRAIGWQGHAPGVAAAVSSLSNLATSISLSFDLTPEVDNRIGFECFVLPCKTPTMRWRTLLDRLEEANLCLPRKADAFLAWQGVCEPADGSSTWPRQLTWGDLLLGPEMTSVIARFQSHVKLVVQPHRGLSVKGYAGFAHYWLPRSAER
jgi:hypothetical protein